ncbi:MAG: bifunctional phosphoribosyl-AMP cyclohydrolase/phosphoribosyl-ATP diphosphatase HisIE [Shewanella sp.]
MNSSSLEKRLSTVLYADKLLEQLDFAKGDGLLPAIVQDVITGEVLMQAYVNREALALTLDSAKVTFYSRSRQQLWCKGETSGNFLQAISISADCDNDSLLIMAKPMGPTCHTGATTCWHSHWNKPFINQLSELIQGRHQQFNDEKQQGLNEPDKIAAASYTASLFACGTKRMAQKVGEEGLETALAAATHDKEELINEAADLMFHLMVLLEDQNLSIYDVQQRLYDRHQR